MLVGCFSRAKWRGISRKGLGSDRWGLHTRAGWVMLGQPVSVTVDHHLGKVLQAESKAHFFNFDLFVF